MQELYEKLADMGVFTWTELVEDYYLTELLYGQNKIFCAAGRTYEESLFKAICKLPKDIKDQL